MNTDSNIAFYPAWGGVTIDGETQLPTSARVHGELTESLANGASSADETGVPYDVNITASSSVAFFVITVIPAENYTGNLTWRATKSTGKVVAEFTANRVCKKNVYLAIQLKYPLWVAKDQQFNIQLIKEDGTLLSTRRGTTRPDEPYRKTAIRAWEDVNVLTAQSGINKPNIKYTPNNPLPFSPNTEPRYQKTWNGKEYLFTDGVVSSISPSFGRDAIEADVPATYTEQVYQNTKVILFSPVVTTCETFKFPDLVVMDNPSALASLSGTTWVNAPKLEHINSLSIGASNITKFDFPNLLSATNLNEGPTGHHAGTNINTSNLSVNVYSPSNNSVAHPGPTYIYSMVEKCLSLNTNFQTRADVTTIGFSKLKYVKSAVSFNLASMFTGLTSFQLLELSYAGGLSIVAPAAATISIPNLKVCPIISLSNYYILPALTSFTSLSYTGNLTMAQVDAILAWCVTFDGNNGRVLLGAGCTITLNAGTTVAPSGTGLANKATLVARGVTVNTK